MKTLITALALMTFNARAAQDIFLFKKSMNPKNVLHYAVDMKPDCSLNQSVATYWIMGESDGHREGLNSKEVKIFTPIISYMNSNKTEMDFNVSAVDMIKKEIPNPEITVRSSKTSACVAKAYMKIDNLEIELSEIYISGSITWTLDWKTEYLIITGKNPDGTAFKKKIVP